MVLNKIRYKALLLSVLYDINTTRINKSINRSYRYSSRSRHSSTATAECPSKLGSSANRRQPGKLIYTTLFNTPKYLYHIFDGVLWMPPCAVNFNTRTLRVCNLQVIRQETAGALSMKHPQSKHVLVQVRAEKLYPPPEDGSPSRGYYRVGGRRSSVSSCTYKPNPTLNSNPNSNSHHNRTGSAACFPTFCAGLGTWRVHPRY